MTFRIDVAGVSPTGGAAPALQPLASPIATSRPVDTGSTAVADHEAAPDPHPQYLTEPEGDAAYDAIGAAAAAQAAAQAFATAGDAAHIAAPDPHTQYVKKAGDTMTGDLYQTGAHFFLPGSGTFFSGNGDFSTGVYGGSGNLYLQTGTLPQVTLTSTGVLSNGAASSLSQSAGGISSNVSGGGPNVLARKAAGATVFANMTLAKSNGTLSSPTTVTNGDNLGGYFYFAHDGTQFVVSSGITTLVTGDVSTSVVPSDILFSTSSATASNAERFRVTNDGNLGVGDGSPTGKLTLNANRRYLYVSSNVPANPGVIAMANSSGNQGNNGIIEWHDKANLASGETRTSFIFSGGDGTSVTDRGGRIQFATRTDGVTNGGDVRLTIKAAGQVRFHPLSADPAGAEAGDMYYNGTTNKHRGYNGTTWNDLY